jgi:HD-like signal output (HDOD) protein
VAAVTETPIAQDRPQGTVEEIAEQISDVSTLPHVALRVMEVANDPDCGARDLKEVMEADVALSTRVLRVVNSSAYAVRTKITNLQQAIAYLGSKQVRNLAMTASVSRLFQQDARIGHYQRLGLWRHLVAVGTCSRLLAMRLRMRNFEDIFLAGLLHDLGIILIDQHFHGPFVELMTHVEEGKPIYQRERACLGFTHTQLAGEVTKKWRFPEGVIAAIVHHHSSVMYRGEHIDTVRCVEVANLVCTLKQISSIGVNCLRVPQATVSALGLSKNDLVVLGDDLDRELEANQVLFQM